MTQSARSIVKMGLLLRFARINLEFTNQSLRYRLGKHFTGGFLISQNFRRVMHVISRGTFRINNQLKFSMCVSYLTAAVAQRNGVFSSIPYKSCDTPLKQLIAVILAVRLLHFPS